MTKPVTTRAAGEARSVQQIWDALRRARAEQRPLTLAHVEDALFRHYLPMARSIARGHTPDGADPDELTQAAEVGLAQAILAWRQPDPDGFERFARAAITDQLRRHDRLTHRRGRGAPPVECAPELGVAGVPAPGSWS
jgi:DNA-directed RNA polymerase specialized sigma subunit